MPPVPIDVRAFETWRKEFPDMFVLNERGQTSMLHRAGCHHFNFEHSESITFAPKWVSDDLVELIEKAGKMGIPCPTCQSCKP